MIWYYFLIDWWRGVSFGGLRSNQWPAIRAAHILKEPACITCGGKDKLTVHHIKPFHLHPELELDVTNLATLCEGAGSGNHHLLFGHAGNYKTKWNPYIREEAKIWYNRFVSKDEQSAFNLPSLPDKTP